MLAYATLFVWSFLAATVLPLGSEPALVATVRSSRLLLLPVLIATLGNYLGACTTYLIGRGIWKAVERRARSPREERAAAIIDRYGQPALLLSWVPLLGDAIVLMAGVARMNFAAFSVWTIVGKAARYAVVAWIAWKTIG